MSRMTLVSRAKIRHGHARGTHGESSAYGVWRRMIERCENSNDKMYKNYGGAGIKVCQRWRHSFQAFLDDMGEPKGKSIGRYCDLANYDPEGCCWMTKQEQTLAQMNKRALLKWAERTGRL
jgi:hypothetical protein